MATFRGQHRMAVVKCRRAMAMGACILLTAVDPAMNLFLILYFLIYGGMNAYFFVRLFPLLRRFGLWAPGLLLAALLFMVAGPILARMLERADLVRPAQAVGLITYTWMAIALWFFFLGLSVDGWNGIWRLGSRQWPELAALRIAPGPALAVIGGLVVVAGIWGAIEAHFIQTTRLTITTDRLPADADPILVAQISDLHLGLIERDGRLAQLIALLERERPDLLLTTGDMVDGSAHHMEHLAGMWAGHEPPLGKFAILGNHEWYVGRQNSIGFLERSGFVVLRGESAMAGPLLVAGVDDPAGLHRTGEQLRAEDLALPPAGETRPFTILLKHRPWIEEGSLGRFDLQLSGHTHAGQIFPFGWVVRMQYPYLRGFHQLEQGSQLYVNRGTGTWGPRLRLGSPPELTLIRIEGQG